MALNGSAVDWAEGLINRGAVNTESSWSFSADDGNAILGGPPEDASDADWERYSLYFLRRNSDEDENSKAGWSYPFAKLSGGEATVYRAGLIAVRQRAGQQDETEIFNAAGRLIDMIDGDDDEEGRKMDTKLPLIERQGDIQSFNEEERTAEIIFSTGATVRRFDFFSGPYNEELSLEDGAIRMDRLNKGAVPFLRDHGRGFAPEIDDVLGRVMSARVEEGVAKAKIKFGERGEIQGIVRDIQNGTIRNVSVGYRIHKMEKIEVEDDIPTLRVIDWEPIEISAVAIGADSGAGFRNESKTEVLFRCEVFGVENEKTQNNETKVETQRDLPDNQETKEKPVMDQELIDKARAEGEQAGVEKELKRQSEIRAMVRKVSLGDEFAEKLIAEKADVDAARTAVIDALAAKDKAAPTVTPRIEAGEQDETKTRQEGMVEAILHRGNPDKYKATDKARKWSGMSLMEMARESMRLRGVDFYGWSKFKVAERALAHSTSDFPEITANIIGKALRDAYMAAPQTFAPFTRRVQNPDFKQVSRVNLGLGNELLLVPQNGEIKEGTISELAEKYKLEEYARMLSISRQTLINDDLDAFVRLPSAMGTKARSLESKLVWAVFTDNAALADGIALFHASHGNLGTPGGIDVTTMGEARKLMGLQTDPDGEPLNLSLNWVIVPRALEVAAEQVTAATQPQEIAKVNPFGPAGRTPTQIIVESRLDADSVTAWYASSTLDQVDMVELATLSGSGEPEVSQEEPFNTLGMKFRVVHSVAAKAIDFRGLFKNAGA